MWCKYYFGKGRKSEKTQHSKLEPNSLWCEFGFKAVTQHCKQKQMLEEGWLPDPQGRSATAHSLVQELFLGLLSASTNVSIARALANPTQARCRFLCAWQGQAVREESPIPLCPRLCLAVESCSRLSQGWDTGRSCQDMKSFAIPHISRNRGSRRRRAFSGVKALLPCLHSKHLPISAA